MILCLDAGNTRVKWGLHDGADWQQQGGLDHANLLQLVAHLTEKPERLLACNVAGAEVSADIEALAAVLHVPVKWFRGSASSCGVTNGYDTPQQLGADRWAALIGARSLHAGSAVVVMAGTATTIDILDKGGTFRGGLILPGLKLMHHALARNTANLPDAQGRYCRCPTNTDDAIVSGALHATLGAITRMAAQISRPANTDFCVLVSGGAAGDLIPHLTPPALQVDNLVLTGLAHAAASGVW
jgi:type III pantothenate kinase